MHYWNEIQYPLGHSSLVWFVSQEYFPLLSQIKKSSACGLGEYLIQISIYTWNWILLMVRSRDECKKDNHFVGLIQAVRPQWKENKWRKLIKKCVCFLYYVIRCFLIYIYWFRCILISVVLKGGMNYWIEIPY